MNLREEARDLESWIEQFEQALYADDTVEPLAHVPGPDHPEFAEIVVEVCRVDLEFGWSRKSPRSLAWYRRTFPDVFGDKDRLATLAFEEYRQRFHAGENCMPEQYELEYGVDVRPWPRWNRRIESVRPADSECPTEPHPEAAHAQLQVGQRVGDFEIVSELGRGAFSHVYLARQADLANRFVVLKLTQRFTEEPAVLAELQHTHIVPIYSLHEHGDQHLICMPFLGVKTLADLLGKLQESDRQSFGGQQLLSTLANRDVSTLGIPGQSGDVRAEEFMVQPAMPPRSPVGDLSFQELVVWMAVRIADGLAFAHDHGVLHHDLKPANILITDDGEPLILDFNLSTRLLAPDQAVRGGTIPYMSPEQILAIQSGQPVDERSDVYSLGVILYELVTGVAPFPVRRGRFEEIADLAWRDRQAPFKRADEVHPAISHDLATMIHQCLEFDPERRYRNARELQSDLDRHARDLPLRYAPSRSLRERARKWMRRHPRMASGSTVALLALLSIVTLCGLLLIRERRMDVLQASSSVQRVLDELQQSEVPLTAAQVDGTSLPSSRALAQDFLNRQQTWIEATQREAGKYQLLPPGLQRQLRERLGRLYYLLSEVELQRMKRASGDEQRAQTLRSALDFNRQALALRLEQPAVYLQAARLHARAGDPQSAQAYRRRAEGVADESRDALIHAFELRNAGDDAGAVSVLQRLTVERPMDYATWFALGTAYAGQQRYDDAAGCFTTCIAIWSEGYWGYFYRGLSRYHQGRMSDAIADLTDALRIQETGAAFFNRGLCHKSLGEDRQALDDLQRACAFPDVPSRVFLVRSRLRASLGDASGAQEDLDRGLREIPRDELSWISRGVAKVAQDPHGALQDFEQALKLNPSSRTALQNRAAVLSERLNQTSAALDTLRKLAELSPRDPQVHASLAVLNGRQGNKAQTVAAAETALEIRRDADILYRVAGAYALLSRQESRYLATAVKLLKEAAWQRPSFVQQMMRTDPDLAPIHSRPEFREFQASLRKLQPPREF